MVIERHPTRGALVMIYSSACKYPRSIKLQQEQVTGLWKCSHWFNVLRMV
jgi:hypothetical protein